MDGVVCLLGTKKGVFRTNVLQVVDEELRSQRGVQLGGDGIGDFGLALVVQFEEHFHQIAVDAVREVLEAERRVRAAPLLVIQPSYGRDYLRVTAPHHRNVLHRRLDRSQQAELAVVQRADHSDPAAHRGERQVERDLRLLLSPLLLPVFCAAPEELHRHKAIDLIV